MARTTLRVSLVAALSVLALAACAPPSDDKGSGGGGGGDDPASATSADDAGGMKALVAAAEKEGELNVIALPPDWANYANIIKGFGEKYDIKVNSQQPDAGSQDEIDAAKHTKGTDRAPDVFDLGQAVALANTDMYAKYKVSTWDDITSPFKDPDGLLGQRLRRLHGDRLRLGQGARAEVDRRPLEARLQGQGRAQR